MTLFRLLTEGTHALERAKAPDAKQDARQLLLAAFHLDMVHFLMNRMQELEENRHNQMSIKLYWEMIDRRCRRCPLQQILGNQEFMGLEFYVNRHVLIPRQDTETLVELVLADMEHRRNGERLVENALLDLCTGSGCIAISLAARGGFQKITITDISKEALKVAERNIRTLLPNWLLSRGEIPWREMFNITEKMVEILQGDLFAALWEDSGEYDVITANPPYIPTAMISVLEPEVREHEPLLALDGAEDGLRYYKRIAAAAGGYLKPGGRIYLEIGFDQGGKVGKLLEFAGYEKIVVHKDLAGKDRVVVAVWPGSEEGWKENQKKLV